MPRPLSVHIKLLMDFSTRWSVGSYTCTNLPYTSGLMKWPVSTLHVTPAQLGLLTLTLRLKLAPSITSLVLKSKAPNYISLNISQVTLPMYLVAAVEKLRWPKFLNFLSLTFGLGCRLAFSREHNFFCHISILEHRFLCQVFHYYTYLY